MIEAVRLAHSRSGGIVVNAFERLRGRRRCTCNAGDATGREQRTLKDLERVIVAFDGRGLLRDLRERLLLRRDAESCGGGGCGCPNDRRDYESFEDDDPGA
jgi:hypothetical protein